jgi:hypothetical protein
MTSTTAPKTPAQRKAVAAKIAKDREAKMTGAALRAKYGDWLTGPVRRQLLREFGHDGLIASSYDRAEAKVKREAQLKAMQAASAERKAAKPRKAAAKAAPSPAQAS